MSDPVVVDRPDRSRFEILVDDEVAGRAFYQLRDGLIVFTHTEVDDRFGGRGIGGALARGALDAARARGLRVRPDCTFVKGWIDKHPEYADLL
ncbi:N-acetyltransferase [Pseudonocardia sulfidoxydans NBRC 16205]|uniref:N-acetyltransferase n=1 Tax=Pseudonocardia sulfidoxydans NBRC 16205 TaxID=1223511 RepID=A0A511DAR4_9PSEU|nr:GNAT family N-acetyltransferase [Pseudonocardia sulfidoxydans]GEL21885.1 N-acetyltransferase [Pseudonocardia sulfidoxydans NBRC 16205]